MKRLILTMTLSLAAFAGMVAGAIGAASAADGEAAAAAVLPWPAA